MEKRWALLRDRKAFYPLAAGMICFFILCSCSGNKTSSDESNENSQPPANSATQKVEQTKPGVKCTEDSPERRGQEGCTILTNRPLVGSVTEPVYWHIDRFDSLATAQKAAGPNAVAAEAHGGVWLMSVEAQTENHHGGRHVAAIGPLTLPAAERFSMRVQSSLLMPGSTTPAHAHPGPEAVYVVDGEQCMETPEDGYRLGAGQFLVVPNSVVHRGRVMGSGARRALGFNLYDAAHAVSHDFADPPPLSACK